jgi:hypothetical protein
VYHARYALPRGLYGLEGDGVSWRGVVAHCAAVVCLRVHVCVVVVVPEGSWGVGKLI